MQYFGSVDPIYNVAKEASMSTAQYLPRERVSKEFATLFYTELMKQALGNHSGIFAPETGNSYFGDTSNMNDIFMDAFIREVISSGGYDNLGTVR